MHISTILSNRYSNTEEQRAIPMPVPSVRIVIDNNQDRPATPPFVAIEDYLSSQKMSDSERILLEQSRKKLAKRLVELGHPTGLTAMRLSKGYSQTMLAKLCGVTQSQISKAENGADLQTSTIERIAAALGVNTVDCFEAYIAGRGDRSSSIDQSVRVAV